MRSWLTVALCSPTGPQRKQILTCLTAASILALLFLIGRPGPVIAPLALHDNSCEFRLTAQKFDIERPKCYTPSPIKVAYSVYCDAREIRFCQTRLDAQPKCCGEGGLCDFSCLNLCLL